MLLADVQTPPPGQPVIELPVSAANLYDALLPRRRAFLCARLNSNRQG
jgi:hypothetical protein